MQRLLQRERQRDGRARSQQGAHARTPGRPVMVGDVPDPLQQEDQQEARQLPGRFELQLADQQAKKAELERLLAALG